MLQMEQMAPKGSKLDRARVVGVFQP
jgi:hypothetical protein